jgi:ElaB/YqjD/DUF883 family membrane-anchored ribosome-binding protein
MQSLRLIIVCSMILFVSVMSINMTEIEDRIESQRNAMKEATSKVEEGTRASRAKHDDEMKAARDRIDKLKADSLERAEKARARAAEVRERTHLNLPNRDDRSKGPGHDAATILSKSEDPNLSQEQRDSYKKLHEFMQKDPQKLHGEDRRKHAMGHPAGNVLDTHGVDAALVEEINRMAASSVSRDALVQHVSTHFPNKQKDDWNDIVIAALGSKGKGVPVSNMDRDKSLKTEALLSKTKFDRRKDSLDHDVPKDL